MANHTATMHNFNVTYIKFPNSKQRKLLPNPVWWLYSQLNHITPMLRCQQALNTATTCHSLTSTRQHTLIFHWHSLLPLDDTYLVTDRHSPSPSMLNYVVKNVQFTTFRRNPKNGDYVSEIQTQSRSLNSAPTHKFHHPILTVRKLSYWQTKQTDSVESIHLSFTGYADRETHTHTHSLRTAPIIELELVTHWSVTGSRSGKKNSGIFCFSSWTV